MNNVFTHLPWNRFLWFIEVTTIKFNSSNIYTEYFSYFSYTRVFYSNMAISNFHCIIKFVTFNKMCWNETCGNIILDISVNWNLSISNDYWWYYQCWVYFPSFSPISMCHAWPVMWPFTANHQGPSTERTVLR